MDRLHQHVEDSIQANLLALNASIKAARAGEAETQFSHISEKITELRSIAQ